MDSKTSRTRRLNDQLRQTFSGGDVLMTRGVSSLDPSTLANVLFAVRSFIAFTPDNDPHGEHDCAVFVVGGQSFIWKIDYYDESFTCASESPETPEATERVLTIMLASEY